MYQQHISLQKDDYITICIVKVCHHKTSFIKWAHFLPSYRVHCGWWMVAPCWEDFLFTARGCLSRQTLGIETIISTPQFLDSCFFMGGRMSRFHSARCISALKMFLMDFAILLFFFMIHDDISILSAMYCWLTVNTGHTNWFLKKDNAIWGRKLKENMYLKGSIWTI